MLEIDDEDGLNQFSGIHDFHFTTLMNSDELSCREFSELTLFAFSELKNDYFLLTRFSNVHNHSYFKGSQFTDCDNTRTNKHIP